MEFKKKKQIKPIDLIIAGYVLLRATVAADKSIPQKTAQAKMSVKRHAKVTANYKRHVASGLVGVAATKCGITAYTVDTMYVPVVCFCDIHTSQLFKNANRNKNN